MEGIRVSIVTPEGLIFDEEVKSATLPGIDGEFGVQANHCALVTLLKGGVIEVVKQDNEKEYVAIDWGHAKVNAQSVDVLAHGAVAIGEGGSIAQNLEKAKTLLKNAGSDDSLVASALYKLDRLVGR